MTAAAIYARKSTEQTGVADDQKSVARQIDHARAYAVRQGWHVDDEHIYVDDGISGAEFSNRPGFVRLMNALKPSATFQALVMSEVSRLGREQIETAYALKQLSVAGVRCFSYLERRELLLESATDKFLLGAVTFAADLEREKARQRVTDTMLRKARAGHVCGGRLFGYDNVCSACGRAIPVGTMRCCRDGHTERRINEAEAAVVRKIFELSAGGTGFTRIAKLLNAERALCPRPRGSGRPAGWAPSSIREILRRAVYRGELVYNASRKRDRWGQRKSEARDTREWIRSSAPALRIVSDEVSEAVEHRLRGVRALVTTPRRTRDIDSAYLLSGFARCAVCGGGLCVMNHGNGSGNGRSYGCLAHHKRGAAVCQNGLRLSLARVDEAVLQKLGHDVLRPAVVMALVDGVLTMMRPETRAGEDARLRAELQEVDREVGRLTEAIARGGQLAPLLDALTRRQARRDELTASLAALEAYAPQRFNRKSIEEQVREHITGWRALLTDDAPGRAQGRQLLREVLTGPLRFTPDGGRYRFEGDAAMGRALAGIAGLATYLASPGGTAQGCNLRFEGIAA